MIQKARLVIAQCQTCGKTGIHIYALSDRRAEPLGKACGCRNPSYVVINGPTPNQWFEEMEGEGDDDRLY